MRRRSALQLIGAPALGAALAPGLSACSNARTLGVGSKDFTEELLLGEMYAAVLGRAGLPVDKKLNLGGTQVAMEALQRGDIDLYPEYTGTALISVLKMTPGGAAADTYATVKAAYAKQFDLVWLEPAPMNDTQALASTQALCDRLHLQTLSDLAAAAPQLRLGAIPEFTNRADGLPGLQRAYGGFAFKEIRLIDTGLKYLALLSGQVDVVVAFGTDGQIAADRLHVFTDDKHFWPTYNVAPVVRRSALAAFPKLEPALNALAPHLTDAVMRRLNQRIDGNHEDPEDVAGDFLHSIGLA